ncbi:hypothetical protein DM02DRAFT_30664 [Periconia macrospinosa]|uniref:Uncharacterized protein n=1 Tax=Periconia macrospinosa TaxID=97972 RepID=A0A2V1DKJ9_9PLEO|nr:hypothetical protein DM02DRAFT_30664 [Periconia macrospinosa]
MASTPPKISNLTMLLQFNSTTGNPTLLRCPPPALSRLQHLNIAEFVTLFTPCVPHPPGTTLARNMDPFEPLGRAFQRKVRHLPYRLDNGMTETHRDFLSASGAIVLVICAPSNVLAFSPKAFEKQLEFCRDVVEEAEGGKDMEGVPVMLLLVTDGAAKTEHVEGVDEFPAVLTLDEYSPPALANAARLILGK